MPSPFSSTDAQKIYDEWNLKAPIHHRVCTEKIRAAIERARKDYEVGEIKEAIDKYGIVCRDPIKYWWTHKGFTLDTFLKRGLTRFMDVPIEEFVRAGFSSQSNIQPTTLPRI